MKFQLSGQQRDQVNSLAVLQDRNGLITFIEALVDSELAKGQPSAVPPKPSAVEQAILALVGK